ncbi:hypothetical protein PAAG_04625 [Paracoccidioides lutzii Pb01]|uniref:Uncharacterized protein n=1 Tax=Paracoccidioides lutzii (strain ATCC MYA-826 / Pb01) TaxID=502779 RepID=C1H1I1_PARBA|nr:hypothetical protein PAAG_04625 [Paracoccidioides lutzii Pb01]EEH33576.2 hypothetical protein PAAG_04625 [Paracoccidioides lutzii Pb01]
MTAAAAAVVVMRVENGSFYKSQHHIARNERRTDDIICVGTGMGIGDIDNFKDRECVICDNQKWSFNKRERKAAKRWLVSAWNNEGMTDGWIEEEDKGEEERRREEKRGG